MRVDSWAKGLLVSVMCLGLLCVFSHPSAAQEFKAAKINLSDVSQSCKKLRAAAEELKKMQLDAEAQMVPLKEQVAKLHEKLKSTEKPLAKEEKDKIQGQLKAKLQEIENMQQAARAKATFKQKSIRNAFFAQLREVVKKLGEKEGLNAIFGSEMLLYSKGVPDLTAKVVEELDAMPPLEAPK